MAFPTLLLVRTTTQAITSNTDTAVSWSSATVNTGPGSWWSSGAATEVVMPYAGPYLACVHISYASNTNGRRAFHFNRGTTISSGNFEIGRGKDSLFTTEASAYCQTTEVIEVRDAGEIWKLAAWHNSSTSPLNLAARIGNAYPAILSLVYLGDD